MHFDRQTGRGAVVPLPEIPTAFLYLRCWFLMAGLVYYFLGLETKGKSIEQIEADSDRDRWFTAAEALEYGFIDHVYERAAQIPSHDAPNQ